MDLNTVLEEIKLELTGGVLDLELEDATLKLVVNKALRELERYWDETTMVTVPFSPCIDLSGFESTAIIQVYRASPIGGNTGSVTNNSGEYVSAGTMDPVFSQQWMLYSGNGGTIYNLNEYIMNFAAWSTLSQIRNTLSTDLAFEEDHHNKKLYINNYITVPRSITIEYIPKIKQVEDIKSDYWIDILIRLCVAMTKQILGRIRTRYTHSGAL